MRGERVYLDPAAEHLPRLKPGQYLKYGENSWLVCTPNGEHGDVSAHEVTEHEDGTITVSPSILVRTRAHGCTAEKFEDIKWVELWHGYLERGIWRSC